MGPKYVLAYPFGGRPVPCDWHLAVWNLQLPTNSSSTSIFTRSVPLEDAQTRMVDKALELDAEYILFIEDDTEPPQGAIVELTRILETTNAAACGGIYPTRTESKEPVVYMGPNSGSYWKWKRGDVFPCWALGFGCMMIKLELFKKLPKPWFKTLNTLEEIQQFPELFPELIKKSPKRCGVTTDIFFGAKLAKLGYKILAHGGVLPKHWDIEKNKGYSMEGLIEA